MGSIQEIRKDYKQAKLENKLLKADNDELSMQVAMLNQDREWLEKERIHYMFKADMLKDEIRNLKNQ